MDDAFTDDGEDIQVFLASGKSFNQYTRDRMSTSFESKKSAKSLRKDEDLKQKKKPDKQKGLVSKLFISDDSDSDAESEGEIHFTQTFKTLNNPKFKLKKNKKLSKSGSSRKSSDKAIFHIAWPHEFAGSDDIEFMSLSMPAFVRGENNIIHNIEPAEYRDKRAEHLTQLMFFKVNNLYGLVLLHFTKMYFEK
ncbi:Hypothetical predicted protein [Mytilus galloprovincialis]|uniref:Uncharacterized protein n=1 Tax=Mytilus galloprovincialis TaxID=29158 RepID=A0A8B6DHU8_MYTGA|nr:Hypothetical predicted protein [Mytilus galloprovincialis]